MGISQPFYVERGGEQAPRQPYDIKETTLYAFVLEADPTALKALLNHDLNQPSGLATNYAPLMNKVILVFSLQQEQYPASPIGWISEIDVGFWIPTWATDPFRLNFYMPYLFVDNGYALSAGREIYGFHKMLGRFQIPRLGVEPDVFTIDTIVSRGADVEAIWERVVQVQRVEKSSGLKEHITKPQVFAQAAAEKIFPGHKSFSAPGLKTAVNLTEHLLKLSGSMVF